MLRPAACRSWVSAILNARGPIVLMFAVACVPAPMPVTPAQVMDAEFVLIQPGTFQMGSPLMFGLDVHTVTLTHAFLIQKTELTQAEWVAVMGSNPSFFNDCGAACPVENVSYENVQAFVVRLNERSPEKHYRLPTEAEWEYAARAGTVSEKLFPDAWVSVNSDGTTHPVGGRPANAWGLYDMEGNVAEWVNDWSGPYPLGPVTDPSGPDVGCCRVVRGGSWRHSGGQPLVALRMGSLPTDRGGDLGFRLARTP
jgi:formylglycine-generating enzyme required for sulfatase activity